MPAACPFCGRIQTGGPAKSGRYGKAAASRYRCACGKNFDFYDGTGRTQASPKPWPAPAGQCKGTCKKFRVKKPANAGRYESGQVLCLICDVWMDHRGAHIKGGLPATEKSFGWFCNCCNNRVRRNSRNPKYKRMTKSKTRPAVKKTRGVKSRIPGIHEMMPAVLRVCKDGKPRSARSILNEVAGEFKLKGQERGFTSSGAETLLAARLRRAIYYHQKMDLVTRDKRLITITDAGRTILKKNPSKTDWMPPDADAMRDPPSTYYTEGRRAAKNRDWMNRLIASALDSIRGDAGGIYLSDLKRKLRISDADKAELLPRLARIEGVSKKEVRHGSVLLDVLLRYG